MTLARLQAQLYREREIVFISTHLVTPPYFHDNTSPEVPIRTPLPFLLSREDMLVLRNATDFTHVICW